MPRRMTAIGLAGLAMTLSMGAAAPVAGATLAVQQYYPGPGVYCEGGGPNNCAPIAYRHEVYSDAGHTNLIGSGEDSCVGDSMIYVTSPNLPAGYQVSTPMYVCTAMGPYLPSGW